MVEPAMTGYEPLILTNQDIYFINTYMYVYHPEHAPCLVEGWGRRPAYEATGSHHTPTYSAIPATGYGQLAISVNIYNILYITYYKTLKIKYFLHGKVIIYLQILIGCII